MCGILVLCVKSLMYLVLMHGIYVWVLGILVLCCMVYWSYVDDNRHTLDPIIPLPALHIQENIQCEAQDPHLDVSEVC